MKLSFADQLAVTDSIIINTSAKDPL